MVVMDCYRLTFTAPFHVDSRGNNFYDESEVFIHSDTLSAAILSTWALLEPNAAAERAVEPPFLLSSAFPYFQETYFLPRPLGSAPRDLPDEDMHSYKKLKKIQWLAAGLWQNNATGGWRLHLDDIDVVQSTLALPKATCKQAEKLKLWAQEERPRLATDRISGAPLEGQLFNFGRVHFRPEAGLYFLARFHSDNDREEFESVLSLLGDSGIGADRSNGNGFFESQKAGDFPELTTADEGIFTALSLVSPAPGDFSGAWFEGASYNLTSRGGWIAHHGLRRQRLRMFTEGSQFRRPLTGRVVEVTPTNIPEGKISPYPIYRDGRGFFIGARGVS